MFTTATTRFDVAWHGAFSTGLRAALLLLIAFVLQACGGGGDKGGNSNPPPPPPPPATIIGTVVSSATGQPVSGVTVKSGSASATTDATGHYTLSNVDASAPAVVTFDMAGYASGLARVAVQSNGTSTSNPRLTPVGSSTHFDAAAGVVATVPNSQAQVSLPPGGLVNNATQAAVSGNVTVELTPIDPAADPGNMPGAMEDANGAIESFGAMSVNLRDAGGNRLNLAAGQTSTIRIPVSTRETSLPASVPLYYLDETTALWVQQGSATLQGAAPQQYYEGTVSHFSHWNIDQPTQSLFVGGCLVDENNKPVAGANVETNGTNYSGKGTATTDANGNFSVGMMRGSGVATVYAYTGDRFSDVQSVGPNNSNVTLPKCLQLKAAGSSSPPQIVANPTDQAVPAGAPATFSVQAVGSAPMSYQWQRNGVDMSGMTQPVLIVLPTVADNGAKFSATVTNAAGSATSTQATLTVGAPAAVQILTQPADQSVVVGQTATFSVGAVAPGQTLAYQWSKNNAPITGATSSSYTTPAVALTDDGATFTVTVSASAGSSATSNPATLHVAAGNTAPTIPAGQPADVTVSAGTSALLSVQATGVPAPTYQWYKLSGSTPVAISGATSSTYSTPVLQLTDNGAQYQVTATNVAGSVTSRTATVTVTQPTGGAGYYLIGSAGPITNVNITYANGSQSVPSQALFAVPEATPGTPSQVEASGGTGIVPISSFQATITGGQITNARPRFVVYFKNDRLWKIDQVVASGTPTPAMVSTLAPAAICGSSGAPLAADFVDGSDWADDTRGWVFFRSPGADGTCSTSDDTFQAVRMNMSDTAAPVVIGQPVAQMRGTDGSLTGLIVRNGTQIAQYNADLTSSTNLFTVDPATFVSLGSIFGSAAPGLWVFVDGTSLYAVNLQNPGTRVAAATIAAGETLISRTAADGANAYVALNTSTASRIIKVTSAPGGSQIATTSAQIAALAVTPTRVVAQVSSTPVSLVSVSKNGGTAATIYSTDIGDLPELLFTIGENVIFSKLGVTNFSGPATAFLQSDGTGVNVVAGTRALHGVAPQTITLSQGIAQYAQVIMTTNETLTTQDSGASLQSIDGASATVAFGTFPQSLGQAEIISPAPMQVGQSGLVQFFGASGNNTVSDLYFIKAGTPGMTRVTTFVP